MYLLFLTAAAWSRVYPFIVKNDLVVLRGFEEKMAWGISYLPPTRDTFLFVTAVERPPKSYPALQRKATGLHRPKHPFSFDATRQYLSQSKAGKGAAK